MEKKDEEHEEQGMNEALTEARPSESAELKNRVNKRLVAQELKLHVALDLVINELVTTREKLGYFTVHTWQVQLVRDRCFTLFRI